MSRGTPSIPKSARVVDAYTPCLPSARCRYTITVSVSTATVVLQDNVPFRDVVTQSTYEYFRFDNPSSGSALSVSLTVLSGDSDLTISTQPQPTILNGTWVSMSPGGDTIVIPTTIVGSYYIGVFGFQNSSFSIVAHVVSDNSTTRLVPGVPQVGAGASPCFSVCLQSVCCLLLRSL